MENKTYSINYFNSKSKKVELKTFEGKNAFEDAMHWGKNNLENFIDDLIISN